ncbi:MAG TPA: hypothetical protein VGC86_11865, partial [Afipia sp.]
MPGTASAAATAASTHSTTPSPKPATAASSHLRPIAHARPPAIGLSSHHVSAIYLGKRTVTAIAGIWTLAATIADIRAIPATIGSFGITAIGAVDRRFVVAAIAEVGTRTIATGTIACDVRAARIGFQHLLSVASPEIHAAIAAGGDIIVIAAELLAYGVVAVLNTVAMTGVMLPRVIVIIDVDIVEAIDVDVVIAPTEPAAPIRTARSPAPHRIADTECNSGGNRGARDIARRTPI